MRIAKRLFVVMISTLFVFGISASTFAEENKSTQIEKKDFPVKIEFENPQYAILTEDYQISYKKDTLGNIIMTKDDFEEMSLLLNDRDMVKKIISDKNIAERKLYSAKQIEKIADECIAEIRKNVNTERDSGKVLINQTRAVDELKNFSSDILAENITYTTTGIEMTFNYVWVWQFQPMFTLTDIVALTWSDDFDTDGRDVGFMYMPSGHRITWGGLSHDYEDTDYITNVLAGDEAYTGYTEDTGFQNKFDIVRSFEKNSKTYRVDQHAGIFQVKIKRQTIPSDDDGAVTLTGGYFHQVLKPDISLDLSRDDFGLNFTGEARYDYNDPVVRGFAYW